MWSHDRLMCIFSLIYKLVNSLYFFCCLLIISHRCIQVRLKQLPASICNISHYFQRWLVYFIYSSWEKIDMDELLLMIIDKHSRFFDRIITDRNDKVCLTCNLMDVILTRQSCSTDTIRQRFINNPFPHLRSKKRYLSFCDKFSQILGNSFSICTRSYQYQRLLGRFDHRYQLNQHFCIYLWSSRILSYKRLTTIWYVFSSNIFCQLKMDDTGSLRLCQFECLSHDSRYPWSIDNTCRPFGDRFHHRRHINDLEQSLLGCFDRFLACDDHHWHGSQLCMCYSSKHIGRSWSQCSYSYTSFASKSTITCSHKYCRLFISCDDQLDTRSA